MTLSPSPALRALTATYRLQLRSGVDFARAEAALPHIADLGVSHLYLSPIFAARAGSTHGYDIIDPGVIEPSLGGRAGFERLSRRAQGLGLSVILDIVPNHMAFSLETPWLRDVLARGAASPHARHFDIAPDRRLALPFLPEPFAQMLARGAFSIATDDTGAPVLRVAWAGGGFDLPLGPAPLPRPDMARDPQTIRALHDAQHWQLCHWEAERDRVSHRRFFNVTGLIGMRVEDPVVFEDMHALVFDLIAQGLVQGLRVDHVDGLVDPAGYLHRLRARVGPDLPIWVEKILTGGEPLPAHWPVTGTTGYEAGRQIARILTPPEGLQRLDRAWRRASGETGDFQAAVQAAKAQVITEDLAAELHQLIDLGRPALEHRAISAGPEALREAILALLRQFPRYRLYIAGAGPEAEGDSALMRRVVKLAARGLRSDRVLKGLGAVLTAPEGPAEHALTRRFEQVTGALIAKSQEDTAFFRYNRCIATNEVGAEPDAATIDGDALEGWMAARLAQWPAALTLTSSHDTKRAEDARMRSLACTHLPKAFDTLFAREYRAMPGVPANIAWYLLQSGLAIWDARRDDTGARLAAHMEKALREGKEISNWTHPDRSAEAPILRAAETLMTRWQADLPPEAQALIAKGQELSLVQLALKMLMPGIPDLYQGCETGAYELTDPDNRAPVPIAGLHDGGVRRAPHGRMRAHPDLDAFDAAKAALTRSLLQLRAQRPEFLAKAQVRFRTDPDDPERFHLERRAPGGRVRIVLSFRRGGAEAPGSGAVQGERSGWSGLSEGQGLSERGGLSDAHGPQAIRDLCPRGHAYPFRLIECRDSPALSVIAADGQIAPIAAGPDRATTSPEGPRRSLG